MSPLMSPPSMHPEDAPPADLRRVASWWEPRRILYNMVLTAVFVALTARTWPRLRPELTVHAIPPLVVLAVLANLCYTAAYAVELLVPFPRASGQQPRWRWTLWLVGTCVAVLLETYWFLDEILPPAR
jgi:hypothetical protein